MVEEKHFFERTGIELAIVAEFEINKRFAVGLASGIESEDIGFVLLRARPGVRDWSQHKKENRKHQDSQRQCGNITDFVNSPLLAPTLNARDHAPVKKGKSNHREHAAEEHILVNVVQDVMTHLVSHHRLDFFGRAAVEKVVIQNNPLAAEKAADIGAYAGGLPRRID